jgi:pimeloyl-ACP methyl ester carboxylesterase
MRGERKDFSRPAWIAVGIEDQITTPAMARQLSTQMPGSRIKYFESAGHMLVVEKPVELSSWLLSIADGLSLK